MVDQVIDIECCINCSQHNISTRHDESKYIGLLGACKNEIETLYPGQVQIMKNSLTNNPRIGAFEVSHAGNIIFSKILSNTMPHFSVVVSKVQRYIDAISNNQPINDFVVAKQTNIQNQGAYKMKKMEPFVSDKVYKSTVRNPQSNTKRVNSNIPHFSPKKHMKFTESKNMSHFYDPNIRRNWVQQVRGENTLNSTNRMRDRFLSVQNQIYRAEESPRK